MILVATVAVKFKSPISAIPPTLYRKMKQEQPETLHITPYLCTFFYELNNKRPPFDDPRVREAVN